MAAPEATLEGVARGARARALVGCGAGGVLGCGPRSRTGTAVAVWAAALDGGERGDVPCEAVRARGHVGGHRHGETRGRARRDPAARPLLLPDRRRCCTSSPPRAGRAGRSAGSPARGRRTATRALFLGDSVVGGGAVGVRFDGVELLPCVSQGAAPVGPELTITAAEGNVIRELAGRPALDAPARGDRGARPGRARRWSPAACCSASSSTAAARVRPRRLPRARRCMGADPDGGTLAVGAPVETGQVVRLHARDAASADRDLRDALGLRARGARRRDAGRRARVHLQRPRPRDVRRSPTTTPARSTRSSPARPRPASSPRARSARSAASFLHGFTATVACSAVGVPRA